MNLLSNVNKKIRMKNNSYNGLTFCCVSIEMMKSIIKEEKSYVIVLILDDFRHDFLWPRASPRRRRNDIRHRQGDRMDDQGNAICLEWKRKGGMLMDPLLVMAIILIIISMARSKK